MRDMDIFEAILKHGADPDYLLEHALKLYTKPEVIDSKWKKFIRFSQPISKKFIKMKKVSSKFVYHMNEEIHCRIIELLFNYKATLYSNGNFIIAVKRILLHGNSFLTSIVIFRSKFDEWEPYFKVILPSAVYKKDTKVLEVLHTCGYLTGQVFYDCLNKAVKKNRIPVIKFLLTCLNLDKLDILSLFDAFSLSAHYGCVKTKTSQVLLQFLAKYIARCEVLGKSPTDHIFYFMIIAHRESLHYYYSMCEEELEKMKTTFIDNDLSMFDALMNLKTIKWWKNENLVYAYKKHTLSVSFPRFREDLMEYFNQLQDQEFITAKAKKCLYRLLQWSDGTFDDIVEEIISYIPNLPLQGLMAF